MSVDINAMALAYANGDYYKPHVSSISFPSFKNISPGETMTFDFPLTLLIGKNGTNKTSVLHALYGVPDGQSVGELWFSLATDSITDVNGVRPAYFYSYIVPETGAKAEVLQTIIKKAGDPDYWEPSRPIIKYGMSPVEPATEPLPAGRLKTRWVSLNKEVVYLDFRSEISAFDKAFYKTVRVRKARALRREKLRKQSRPLKEAIDTQAKEYSYYGKERVFENYTFPNDLRAVANHILDTDYEKIVYIEHDFYLTNSFSVHLTKGRADNYSEAFAGSGETAIMRLIYALNRAPENSLVLLDEPETSLHIDAQMKLRDYILDLIHSKRLQVVISTHSPYFASGLPEQAIKVLYVETETRKIKFINSAPADETTFHLGLKRPPEHKMECVVEDSLASSFTQHVVKTHLTASQQDKIVVTPFSGGANAMLDLAAGEMLKTTSNTLFLFDGDQKPHEAIPDPDTIPEADNPKLEDLLTKLFKKVPRFALDSSDNNDQKYHYMRLFLAFAKRHFAYIPYDTTEKFITDSHSQFAGMKGSPKKLIADHIHSLMGSSGSVTAKEILFGQRMLLGQIETNNPIYAQTAAVLIQRVTQ